MERELKITLKPFSNWKKVFSTLKKGFTNGKYSGGMFSSDGEYALLDLTEEKFYSSNSIILNQIDIDINTKKNFDITYGERSSDSKDQLIILSRTIKTLAKQIKGTVPLEIMLSPEKTDFYAEGTLLFFSEGELIAKQGFFMPQDYALFPVKYIIRQIEFDVPFSISSEILSVLLSKKSVKKDETIQLKDSVFNLNTIKKAIKSVHSTDFTLKPSIQSHAVWIIISNTTEFSVYIMPCRQSS